MADRENESLAEWLFYVRKSQHRRRVTHTTRTISTTQNTDREEHE